MQTPRTAAPPLEIQTWPIDRLVLYARNPRKNDAVVDRMCSSIREFGFKIPVLARSDGEVVDGHLRIKAARKLRIDQIPVILCDEWTPAKVKAFRLMVNRSVTWASWDDELLALELQELNEADFDLSLTGFDPGEIDNLLVAPEDDERANAAPPLPEIRFPALAISGCAEPTECSVEMPLALKLLPTCWATASHCFSLLILHTALNWIPNGATAPA
jgi:ParB-like chromosome segregation protein Spo0J